MSLTLEYPALTRKIMKIDIRNGLASWISESQTNIRAQLLAISWHLIETQIAVWEMQGPNVHVCE